MRFRLIGLLLATATLCHARSLMLVYQQPIAVGGTGDLNFSLVTQVKAELDQVGKVAPLVYDVNSNVIKMALESKQIKVAPAEPTKDQLMAIAKGLQCKYLLIVQAQKVDEELQTSAELYLVGRSKPIWGPVKQTFKALVGNTIDFNNASASAGRTIALQLNDPLAKEDAEPLLGKPDPGHAAENTTPPAPPENKPWTDGLAAFTAEDYTEAAALLREAVDRDPLNPDIRITLIRTYERLNMLDQAMDEMDRSLRLLSDVPKLRTVQAGLFLRTGRLRDAEVVYRTLLIKNKDDVDATVGLAEVMNARLMPAEAARLYRQARQIAPTNADYAWALSETLAIEGDFENSLKERDAAVALGLSKDAIAIRERYHRLMTIVGAAENEIATAVSAVHADAVQAKGHPDPDLNARIADVLVRTNNLIAYLEQLPKPKDHEASHARRVYGLNLLSQSIISLKRGVEDAQEDALDESALTRSEALREIVTADKLYQDEVASQPPIPKGKEKPPQPGG